MAPVFSVFAAVIASAGLVSSKIYFKEDFSSKDWDKRWTVSTNWKPKVSIFYITINLHYI